MKKIILAVAIVATSFAASAQSKSTTPSTTPVKFGGGVRVGLPVGDFGDAYSFALGAELQGEYMFSPQASATLTTGYTNFFGKTVGGYKVPSHGSIPILAGLRYYPSTEFFVGAKAGISFSTETGGGSDFTYEPQVGYNAEKFQVALGYQAISGDGSTAGHIGLTGIFKFN